MKKLLSDKRGILFLVFILLPSVAVTNLRGQNLGSEQLIQLQSLSPEQRSLLMQRLQGGRELSPNPSNGAVDQTAETLDQDEAGADKDSSEKGDEEEEVGKLLSDYEFELEVDLLRLEKLINGLDSKDNDEKGHDAEFGFGGSSSASARNVETKERPEQDGGALPAR